MHMRECNEVTLSIPSLRNFLLVALDILERTYLGLGSSVPC